MAVMTGGAVGNREEFDGVARGGKLIGCAAELDFAIVGVRPDTDDLHRMEWCDRSAPVSSSQRLQRGYAMFVTRPNVFVFSRLGT